MEDPSLLRSDFPLKNRETGELIPVAELQRCYTEHLQLAHLVRNLERGIVTISLDEYNRMPAVLIDAWMMYRQMLTEREADRHERMIKGMM